MGEDDLKNSDKLIALINQIRIYEIKEPAIAKQEFEKSLYREKYQFTDSYGQYIIVGKDIFSYRVHDIFDWNHQDINDKNYCYGCCSGIRKGKCHGCSCKQKLILNNNMGVPNGEHYISNFYIYKRKKKYYKQLTIAQKFSDKIIINEFYLEKEPPYQLKIWLDR